MFSPRSKTWTFPNLKTPAGPADVYLAVEEEEQEAVSFGTPFRAVRAFASSSHVKFHTLPNCWPQNLSVFVALYKAVSCFQHPSIICPKYGHGFVKSDIWT